MSTGAPYEPLEVTEDFGTRGATLSDVANGPQLGADERSASFISNSLEPPAAPALNGTPGNSQAFFVCYGMLILCMMTSTLCVLAIEGLDAPCDRPLLQWILIHVGRHILKGILFGCKQYARDRNHSTTFRIMMWSIKTIEVLGLVWWLKGAHWLYKLNSCSTLIYGLMVTFFSIQTVFLLIPCLVLLMICACLPVLIWVLPIFVPQNSNQQATSEETIEKLSKYAWNTVRNLDRLGQPADNEELKMTKTCSICLCEFEDGQEVMEMPCDKRHLFHADCVGRWLRTSQNCPLCRSNIPQKIDAADEQQNV